MKSHDQTVAVCIRKGPLSAAVDVSHDSLEISRGDGVIYQVREPKGMINKWVQAPVHASPITRPP